MKKFATIALLAITISVSLTACSFEGVPFIGSTKSVAPLNPAATPLAEAGNAFFKAVGEDALAPEPTMTPDKSGKVDPQEQFNAGFKKSIALIKPGSMTQLVQRKMLATFGRMYVADSTAKVETAPEDFVIDGTKAHIKSGRLKVTYKGKLQPAYEDEKSATLYFESVKGKWMVSGYNPTG